LIGFSLTSPLVTR